MTSYLLRQREWEELRFEGSPLQAGSHSLEPANIWKIKNMCVNMYLRACGIYIIMRIIFGISLPRATFDSIPRKGNKKGPIIMKVWQKKVPDEGERCHWRVGLTLNGSRYLAMSFPW